MLRIPGTTITVHRFLADLGPSTLAALSGFTGLPQQRLRTHLRSHRDAYHSEAVILDDGIKLRLWRVKGPIE